MTQPAWDGPSLPTAPATPGSALTAGPMPPVRSTPGGRPTYDPTPTTAGSPPAVGAESPRDSRWDEAYDDAMSRDNEPDPDEYPADDDDFAPQQILWRVTGWTPESPFRGDFQFTTSDGDLLLTLPVDPATMQSLHDISGTVLDAQHTAFGHPAADPANASPAKKRGWRLPGRDIGQETTVVDKTLFGVPFRMNIRPKALTMVGGLLGGVLLLAIMVNVIN